MAKGDGYDWTFFLNVNESWIEDYVMWSSTVDVGFVSDIEDDKPTQYRWTSPHLDGLTDIGDVWRRALALKALYDGAMLIHRLGKHSIHRLDGPVENKGACPIDPSSAFFADPFAPDRDNWYLEDPRDPLSNDVTKYIFMARDDEVTRGILSFLGANGLTWIALYGVVDFLKNAGLKEEQIAAAGGVPMTTLKVFKATANNYAALGPFARHGAQGWQPPPKPMTRKEAVEVVLRCARGFLDARAASLGLEAKVIALRANKPTPPPPQQSG